MTGELNKEFQVGRTPGLPGQGQRARLTRASNSPYNLVSVRDIVVVTLDWPLVKRCLEAGRDRVCCREDKRARVNVGQ